MAEEWEASVGADEGTLLRAAVAGDRGALTELLERHGPTVRRSLAGKIGVKWQSLVTEDDVLQQAYADAISGIAHFRPAEGDAFQRWLFRLAKNNLLDAIRSLQAEKNGGQWNRIQSLNLQESSTAFLEQIHASIPTASSRAIQQESVELLQEALSTIPPAYREVVRLYDLEGRSTSEVSQLLQIRQGAMFMRRSRAIEMLRDWFQRRMDHSRPNHQPE